MTKFRIATIPAELIPERRERKYYMAALLVNLVIIGILASMYGSLPSKVPLFFSLPWGEARLASRVYILILPVLGIIFMLVNLAVMRITRGEKVWTVALAAATLLVNVMLLTATLGILQSVI